MEIFLLESSTPREIVMTEVNKMVNVYDKIMADDRKANHLVNQQELAVAIEHAQADRTHTCSVRKQFVVEPDAKGPNTKSHCPDGTDKKLATLARVDSDGEKKASQLLDKQRRNHHELIQLLRKIAELEGLPMKALAGRMSLKVKDLIRLENGPKIRAWYKKYQDEQRRKGLSAPIANKVASKPEPKPKKATASRMAGNAKMTPQQRKFYNRLPRSSASATAFLEASSEDRNKLMAAHRK